MSNLMYNIQTKYCTNMDLYAANMQMCKRKNVKMCMCTNVQMYKCANVQIYNCTIEEKKQISSYVFSSQPDLYAAHMQMYKRANVQQCKCKNILV